MARCARRECRRWRPNVLARRSLTGFHLDDAWYCSSACLELAARRRLKDARRIPLGGPLPIPPLKLGILLIHQRTISQEMLQRALDEQRRTGLRIGAQLQRLGYVQSQDVLQALAAQAGVAYLASLDSTCLADAPGNLSRDAVRALGLVPFEADPQKRLLKVACVPPLPRLAISAMREFTGWVAEPYLVSDELWPELVSAYGTARPTALAPVVPATMHDVADAAARVARVAEDGRAVRITQARCDPYTWVRAESPRRVEDLLLSVDEDTEEDSCQVAPTSR